MRQMGCGACRCECPQCDIGNHCGDTSKECYWFEDTWPKERWDAADRADAEANAAQTDGQD